MKINDQLADKIVTWVFVWTMLMAAILLTGIVIFLTIVVVA